MTKDREKFIIGCSTDVSFTELGIEHIPAKVDTGAFFSTLSASNVKVKTIDGQRVLTCRFLFGDRGRRNVELGTVYRKHRIYSSNGHYESRYIVPIKVTVAGVERVSLFSLTNREPLRFPILMGREFLEHGFLVDANKDKLPNTEKSQETLDFFKSHVQAGRAAAKESRRAHD